MEGSGIAKPLIRGDTNEIFRRAGLPASAAAAWVKARPRVKGALKRDSVAGTKFWHRAAGSIWKNCRRSPSARPSNSWRRISSCPTVVDRAKNIWPITPKRSIGS